MNGNKGYLIMFPTALCSEFVKCVRKECVQVIDPLFNSFER